jgi:hypothetical protein
MTMSKFCRACGEPYDPLWGGQRLCMSCKGIKPDPKGGGGARDGDPASEVGGGLWVERRFKAAERRQRDERRRQQTDVAWWQL